MDFIQLLPKLWQVETTVSDECRKHILMITKHLLKGSSWALQMLDSSTKLPAGLLEGNVIDLGNFDECIKLNVNEDMNSFRGQHCLASGSFNFLEGQTISTTWSMCTPSSCSANDLTNLLFIVLNQTIQISPETCHIKQAIPFTAQDCFAISILVIFGVLCILSTAYDIRVTYKGKKRDILRAFSWYTNGKKLLEMKNNSGDKIQCLQGLRYLSIVWIAIGHSYLMQGVVPTSNMNTYTKSLTGWDRFPIGISNFAVESFLLMSGFLVGYTFFKTTEKGKKIRILNSYIVRYLRLTPALAIITLTYSGLITHFGWGPIWKRQMDKYPSMCKNSWWATLLYVQNYMSQHEMCVPEAWYLAVDTQLYFLSPLLLIPLSKRPRFGPTVLKLAIAASITISFLQLYIKNVTFGFQPQWRHEFAENFFTHTRATPWLIGLSLSYFIQKTRSCRQDINQWHIPGLTPSSMLLGWLLGSMCMILPVVWSHRFSQTDFLPSSLEFSLYFSLSKPMWCLGLSWFIFACMTGYGGTVNNILSSGILQPFSRLTYCIYLIYFPFMLVKTSSVKNATYFSDYKQVHSVLGTLTYVMLLAVPLHLTFEAPVVALTTTTSHAEKTINNKPSKA